VGARCEPASLRSLADGKQVTVPHDATPPPPAEPGGDALRSGGDRLRSGSRSLPADAVGSSVLRRRTRALGAALGASVAVAAVLGVALVRQGDEGADLAGDARTGAGVEAPAVERFLATLPERPTDPTEVRLVSSVSTYADCGSLIGDLRQAGAEHVGSRGFGGFDGILSGWRGDEAGYDASATASAERAGLASDRAGSIATTAAPGETLGTNVQVEGVDELDLVKAVGDRIYDLDGRGNLRITAAGSLEVLGTVDVTPRGMGADDEGDDDDRLTQVRQLLVDRDRVALFGSEVEVSEPVEGDPSATRASTQFLTVTFVDASDPSAPTITDRVRIEGSLVSARLVDGEVRMVTTSNMADLGFVMPTTPTSVPKALEQNRRSVATSTAADWIPDWQRSGEDPQGLVPCERVHVPDTFAGIAMTSMVTFPVASGRFDPLGTSIVAPGATLYAGLERVAISSEVWVDPIDRDRLEFDDWQTAIHEFSFLDGEAPGYEGSGIVDGSTVGQFAYGEIGESLAVVTTEGVPWEQEPDVAIDLTVLTPDGDGELEATSTVEDLADGKGAVAAVRFVEGRVLVSTGTMGRLVLVIDVTDPAAPRRAGGIAVPGEVGYFHPLPDGRALTVGRRDDLVGSGDDQRSRSWVVVHQLDVRDPDAPAIVGTWERPWSADDVAADHHAFTFWPSRQLALWGITDTDWDDRDPNPNHAVVLRTDGGVGEVAVPVASKPNEVPPPCPVVEVTDAEVRQMIGPGTRVLRCDEGGVEELVWPRYECWRVDDAMVARFVPEDQRSGSWFTCDEAPPPRVARVLVVSGRPILLTDQTLEALDPETFASTQIAHHPSRQVFGY
jgi:hypothetical protein